MKAPESVSPGYFEAGALQNAPNKQLTPFTTGGWANMSELFVQLPEGRFVYPRFADALAGYLPDWEEDGGKRHPLRGVETALRQDLHTESQPLRLLSFQVGQINNGDRSPDIAKWERQVIADVYNKLEGIDLVQPQPDWTRDDFAQYYEQVRVTEAAMLLGSVVSLAKHIKAQNQKEQLFVAREALSPEGSGWLAPLVGLSIDTKYKNDYRDQVHDVLPVVSQNNDETTLLRGATAGLYTAYAPNKGFSK